MEVRVEQETKKERVIVVGINRTGEKELLDSLEELKQLVETAGGETVGVLYQSRVSASPGTYLGTGKLQELVEYAAALEADAVVCDDELTPAQLRNLQDVLDCKVLDRTLLILDIFAMRANTSEGKLQVELAQLRHRLTMLTGVGKMLSRQGGGIGTRGPGETKLETDRRLIRGRIGALKAQLEEVKRHREVLRENRKKKLRPVAAIVGYTNAGKSTLLNALTGADVLSENKLFATLDPTTREMILPDEQEILLTDTVGFIRKLPHHLVDAFRGTLEEAKYADVIVHVVDASSDQMQEQMYLVYETLKMLGVADKPILTLFNKMDRLPMEHDQPLRDPYADQILYISAATGEALDRVPETLGEMLTARQVLIERTYGYDQAGRIALIRKYGRLLEEEYREDGIYVKAFVPLEVYGNV